MCPWLCKMTTVGRGIVKSTHIWFDREKHRRDVINDSSPDLIEIFEKLYVQNDWKIQINVQKKRVRKE